MILQISADAKEFRDGSLRALQQFQRKRQLRGISGRRRMAACNPQPGRGAGHWHCRERREVL